MTARRRRQISEDGDPARVQLKLTMSKSEHEWFKEEAQHHRTTLNGVILGRALESREQERLRTISMLVEEASRKLQPLLKEGFERALYGNCIDAARRGFDLIRPLLPNLSDRVAIDLRKASDDFDSARHALERTVGEKVINRGTT